jgi:tetratricopeptide (TPR) repeat protein
MKYSKKVTSFFLCIVSLVCLADCAGPDIREKAAQSQFNSGLSLFEGGQYEEAIPHFEKATELAPGFWKAHLYLGRSYLSLEKWNKALPPLKTAFRIAPEESHKEISRIVMDVFFRNTSKIDQDTQSQFIELLGLK